MSNFAFPYTQSRPVVGGLGPTLASQNPLRTRPNGATLRAMSRLVIRCDRRGASSDELEAWLEQEAGRLARHDDQRARVSRLTRQRAGEEQDVGWLVEIERADSGVPAVDHDALADLLRDMRLVGLEPRVLASGASQGRTRA